MAMSSSRIPTHLVHALLDLSEFMAMHDKRLPIDAQLLARRAQAANMFAKSLYYLEAEFNSPNVLPSIECVDAMIKVNNELGFQDKSIGLLNIVSEKYPHIQIKPFWLEELDRWEDACRSYMKELAQYDRVNFSFQLWLIFKSTVGTGAKQSLS
jgi:hypothetical protein